MVEEDDKKQNKRVLVNLAMLFLALLAVFVGVTALFMFYPEEPLVPEFSSGDQITTEEFFYTELRFDSCELSVVGDQGEMICGSMSFDYALDEVNVEKGKYFFKDSILYDSDTAEKYDDVYVQISTYTDEDGEQKYLVVGLYE